MTFIKYILILCAIPSVITEDLIKTFHYNQDIIALRSMGNSKGPHI